jgi:hypothetical protein
VSNPNVAKHRWFITCKTLSKGDMGTVHLHSRPWRRNRVLEIVYYAPGGGIWEVSEEKWDAFTAASSHEAAMAVLRRS